MVACPEQPPVDAMEFDVSASCHAVGVQRLQIGQVLISLIVCCLQIAVQVALLIAKAARFDFPQQWPSLFSDLLAGITVQPQPPGTPAAVAVHIV